ncbi:MBL fold metallo-hydrolase [Planotetraspora kaengkrachanensis]|uniref:MBL fold metallo-hydrolase n=1 Tax=Planotetraspora kaengkrachanensis TaxID=575193 RepID=A0A8J3PWB3_9ACTN|nr:MBL fold metallo-hydrolase [Planotetraspora kaengkrachanensis]GIG82128.1 MBL fold metallo-hydrolase [Planotetraspora kaengkrachanensis]
MRLALLGVRGSTPAPGPEFVRYGGHTSCVAVLPDDSDVPRLVLDAGTGLRGLGRLLGGEPFRGSIVLTHLHWDHLQGLPFCPPVDRPDSRVDLHLPGDGDPRGLLARMMSPPHFPIDPGGLRGDWRFRTSADGVVEGYTVRVAEIAHKGGVTHGIRVEGDGVCVAYLPDHCPQIESAAAEKLASGADLLLHDGQFLSAEQETADAYGHATIGDAVAFARRCGARRLVLTHHAPGRTDDALDVVAATGAELARQGDVLSVGAP